MTDRMQHLHDPQDGSRGDHFRALLEAEAISATKLLVSLGHDIDTIADARKDSSTDDEHDPEGSTLAFERSQAQALLATSTERLAEVAAAIERIDAGAFGVCVNCGRPISEGRLEARPWTTLCIDCASRPRR
jgi:RNA polymerase-binding transcription factor DksA